MNERQRRKPKRQGATHTPEPDFVLRADEVPSKRKLQNWVTEKLEIGPGAGRDRLVDDIRQKLKVHGAARISTCFGLKRMPDMRSLECVAEYWPFYVVMPLEDAGPT
jgi:hypothetical protein